jgi:hypothetical protein
MADPRAIGFPFPRQVESQRASDNRNCLIRSGYRVRALLRPTNKRTNLAGIEVEIVEGDMRDAASVARAMAGTRFLFHVAADYRLWVRNPQEILWNNREGPDFLCKRRWRQVWRALADATMRQIESCAIGA